jgi:hypothetical protein
MDLPWCADDCIRWAGFKAARAAGTGFFSNDSNVVDTITETFGIDSNTHFFG